MTKYAAHKKIPKPIKLIYSNTSTEDIPFKKDLDEYHANDTVFSVHYTITGNPPPNWKGKTCRIDEAMIKELVPYWRECEFYISGPAKFVLELKNMVAGMGIPVDRLKSEMFTGY
jgi:NADH oxidoreductase Hcr